MMHTLSALQSSRHELSVLSKQMEMDQGALTNHKYLESAANRSLNSCYFPYYALVERYIGSTIEYTAKLEHFKELLLESLRNRNAIAPHHEEQSAELDVKENKDAVHHDGTPDGDSKLSESLPNEYSTPMSSTPIECEFLPTIDEDKETVFDSHHSFFSLAADSDRDDASQSEWLEESEAVDAETAATESIHSAYDDDDSGYVYSDEELPADSPDGAYSAYKELRRVRVSRFDALRGDSARDLESLFGAFGAVTTVEIEGAAAAVEFESIEGVGKCLEAQSLEMDGRALSVEMLV